MKINYLAYFLLLTFPFLSFAAENCEDYKTPEQSLVKMDYAWSFNNIYPYELCKLNAPIHEEAIQYIQDIKNKEWQDIQEVVTEAGNVFCRGYFGECGDASFYTRFVQSCEDAQAKTGEQLKEKKKKETISADFIAYSYNSCDELSATYAMAYKEVAMEEAGRYHKKFIEESAEEYLTPSQEKMLNLGIVWDSFVKIFGNIARSVEWWTQTVFNV